MLWKNIYKKKKKHVEYILCYIKQTLIIMILFRTILFHVEHLFIRVHQYFVTCTKRTSGNSSLRDGGLSTYSRN